ncbi:hypothetical protein [Paraflavitalea pollutisoli]|uniref:hypothetical protein n=1 Tax=Paraflavitalea pollutisoli TaxID=3034143 RepID=UPI0023EB96E9|nr:hypothetical protein [Paraflavitalea sp. H1-2-19X]
MKKYFKILAVLALMMMGQAKAFAQDEETTSSTAAPTTPRWVSEKGYWIIESNIHVPKQYTVRFYNNDQVMIYKEEVKGVALKVERRKVKMHLKRVLETALIAWNKQQQAKENEGWVANAIR